MEDLFRNSATACCSVSAGQHLFRAVDAFQVLGSKSSMDYLFSIGNISLRWLLLSAPLLQKEAGLEPFTSLSEGTRVQTVVSGSKFYS